MNLHRPKFRRRPHAFAASPRPSRQRYPPQFQLAPAGSAGIRNVTLIMGGIHENKERVIRFLLATLGQVHKPGLAAEPHRERLRLGVSPVRLRHLCAVRAKPDDVLDLGAGDGLAVEEPVAMEDDVCAPKQR